ncbi:MAG: hypothetical protein QG583_281 [Patescibacteria group bacterium]|nr:hypothetical protein [Patescibacteria group bacterium]
MSDEKEIEIPKIHGFEIDSKGHDHALHFLKHHVDKEQMHEMVKNAKNNYDRDHNSHFTARVGAHDMKYTLQSHHGKLEIHQVHHNH